MITDKPVGKVTHLPDEHDRQLSALYHQTEAELPAEHIDRYVLEAAREAAARAAMQAKPALGKRRVPLSVAATILVMTGLVPLLLWNLYLRNAEVAELATSRVPEVPADVEERPETGVMPGQDAGEIASAMPLSTPLPAPEEADAAGASPPSPEQVALDEILALSLAGQDVEAWKRFGDFRREHPGFRIPDAVLDQLAAVRARLLEQAADR